MSRRASRWLLAAAFASAGILVGGRAGPGKAARTESMTPRAAPSTLEMGALLKELSAKVDPAKLTFVVDDRRAEMFARQLSSPHPVVERLQLRLLHSAALLNAGRVQDSLLALDALEEDLRKNAPAILSSNQALIRMRRALAYMRMAEEQNCHDGSNRDSCLLPIRGKGVHQRREGSTRAIEILNEVLAAAPENLQARWLLNVAHMTLGSYPDEVPRRHLIPPSAFASQYPLPRFDNVAREAGVDVYGLAGGAILDDFDHDGRLDLALSSMGLDAQMRLFRNRGDGTFEDRTEQAGLMGEVGGLNMVHADYDNDGFVDILVLRGGWFATEGRFPFSLLRNNGDLTFTDVTKAAGLMSHLAPTQTAAWLDYDGDGALDLFVGNESVAEGTDPAGANPCELFHNNGDGTFVNVAHEAGVDVVRYVKGVSSGDYNNDGRPDLYLSVQSGENLLLRNDGAAKSPGSDHGWRFTNVAAAAGVTEPKNSFGVFFFDYDNDGWPDLFVAGYSLFFGSSMAADTAADYLGLPTTGDRGRLYRNRRDGTFEDVTRAAGLYKVIPAMGLNFGDLDNDGWLDIYLGTGNPDFSSLIPNRMFRNAGGRGFQDVTTAGNFGHLQKGHAVVFGDIDNDGDQDVFEEMGGAYLADKAYSALYENPGNPSHWMGLELEGVRSNRSAIGARIKVEVETEGGPRFLYRTVGSVGSFGGSPLRQAIGLGDARGITSVEITWPATGQTQEVRGLELDQHYRVREGSSPATRVDRPRFKIGASASPPEKAQAPGKELPGAGRGRP